MGLTQLMLKGVNKLPAVDQALMDAMGGDPNYAYFWSAFAVEPGEALLLHLPYVPECDNWGLCLYNYWLESLDYTQAQRSEEHTSELQSLMRISYAVLCLKKKKHPSTRQIILRTNKSCITILSYKAYNVKRQNSSHTYVTSIPYH